MYPLAPFHMPSILPNFELHQALQNINNNSTPGLSTRTAATFATACPYTTTRQAIYHPQWRFNQKPAAASTARQQHLSSSVSSGDNRVLSTHGSSVSRLQQTPPTSQTTLLSYPPRSAHKVSKSTPGQTALSASSQHSSHQSSQQA